MPTLTETSNLERLRVFDARDSESLHLAVNQLAGLGPPAFLNVFPPQFVDRARSQVHLNSGFPSGSWRNPGGREIATRTGSQLPDDDGLGSINRAIFERITSLGRRFAPDASHSQHF